MGDKHVAHAQVDDRFVGLDWSWSGDDAGSSYIAVHLVNRYGNPVELHSAERAALNETVDEFAQFELIGQFPPRLHYRGDNKEVSDNVAHLLSRIASAIHRCWSEPAFRDQLQQRALAASMAVNSELRG